MKKSTKAVLLSALVFPGLGHLVLRHYLRGSLLVVCSLAALTVVVRIAFQQAQSLLDHVASGEIPMDATAIGEAVSNASNAADDRLSGIAFFVYIACWLIGIFDAYRVGSAAEQRDAAQDIS
jgi:hypothetical protein